VDDAGAGEPIVGLRRRQRARRGQVRGRGDRRSRRARQITSTTWRCSIDNNNSRGRWRSFHPRGSRTKSLEGVRFYDEGDSRQSSPSAGAGPNLGMQSGHAAHPQHAAPGHRGSGRGRAGRVRENTGASCADAVGGRGRAKWPMLNRARMKAIAGFVERGRRGATSTTTSASGRVGARTLRITDRAGVLTDPKELARLDTINEWSASHTNSAPIGRSGRVTSRRRRP